MVLQHYIILPFKGPEGEGVVRKFKGDLLRILPPELKPRFVYKGTKLGSFFRITDKVKT